MEEANVTLVHKKDSMELAENYRPISLLSILSKVLECCWVCIKLYHHVKQFVSPFQHGFLRSRSCITQLLSVLNTIGHHLDKNIKTDVVYLDFVKAFDSVDHSVMLQKLKRYGVEGGRLAWFTDNLSGRSQRVILGGVASQQAPAMVPRNRSSSGQSTWPGSICSFYEWSARCSTGRYSICSLCRQHQSLQFYLVCSRLWTTTTSSDKPPFLESWQ